MATDTVPIHQDIPPLRVRDGIIFVGATRVPIDTIVYCFMDGMTPESIADDYDALSLPDVYGAIAYYLQHKDEVDAYIRRREEAGDALRKQITSDPAYQERIQRLLDRARHRGLRP